MAEAAVQLVKMVGHLNQSQPNPSIRQMDHPVVLEQNVTDVMWKLLYLHVASEVVGGVADLEVPGATVCARRALCRAVLQPYVLFVKHACSILRQSSNPECGFSMMEQGLITV